MASLTTVRAALATRLASISGLNVHATTPAVVQGPAAIVTPAPGTVIRYATDFSGTEEMSLVVIVLVGMGDHEGAQEALNAYMADSGSSSIYAAVNADHTLGGAVMYAIVTDARAYSDREVAGVQYLSVEFGVEVRVA